MTNTSLTPDVGAADVSVIIVTYNSADTIAACLDSIAGQAREILVLDNNSSDETVPIVRRQAGVTLIESDDNMGFARGCNVAAARARSRMLLMLNPDTVVIDDAIRVAADHLAASPNVGAVGATTLYEDGSLNPTCCFDVPTVWSTFTRAVGLATLVPSSSVLNPEEIPGWDRRSTRSVGAVTGCFLMLERAFFEQLGGFDERFFMYSEDTDLSMRVADAGRSCVHLADAVVVHHGGRSDRVPAMKMVKVLTARSQLFRKHWSRARASLAVRLLDVTVAMRAAASVALGVVRPSTEPSKWIEVWRHRSAWRNA